MDFGVWVSYHANKDSTYVERFVEPATEESPAKVIVNEIIKRGLNYEIPFILSLKLGYLTVDEKEVSRKTLDIDKMTDEVI